MLRSTYFVQECPTCGRNLQIRVEYLGRQVVCQHCHAHLEAADPSNHGHSAAQSGISLLRRAEELLESVDQRRQIG